MTQDFPNCTQCGAAPDSRESEYCRFCGAPLPWSQFDLRSRRVVVVVSERTMEEAIEKVVSSAEYALASINRRGRIRRLRQRQRARRRAREEFSVSFDEEQKAQLLVLSVPLGLISLVAIAQKGWPAFVGVGAVLAFLAVMGVRQSSKVPRRRRGMSLPRRHVVLACGIVELGAPRPLGKHDSTLIRDVTLRTKNGDRRTMRADVHLDLHAGDVGIAKVRGPQLESFRWMEHVGEEASGD